MNFGAVTSALPKSSGHRAFLLLGLAFTALLSVSAGDKAKPSVSHTARSESGYISALAAVNRFLQAWQNQDHETGLLMLTDTAKQQSSEDRLESFFASGSDAAYEIARGRKRKDGSSAFPVALFTSHSVITKSDRRQRSEVIVVPAGGNEWAIDKLP